MAMDDSDADEIQRRGDWSKAGQVEPETITTSSSLGTYGSSAKDLKRRSGGIPASLTSPISPSR